MLDSLFASILTTSSAAAALSLGKLLLCTATSLVLGAAIAAIHTFRNRYTKGFVMTLALLPAVVQMVILMVNGNLGTGVAVAGAFSLVRFRSAPGSAREICSIFLAMAVGLATGMGYLAAAALFVLVIGGASILYTCLRFGEQKQLEKELKITIPETLDYTDLFDDLFARYTAHWKLEQVKTTNMGSLYRLDYRIALRDPAQEKAFLDELRCRNGNLEIVCGRLPLLTEEL
ncbi:MULTISPECIES: DUF4956 domain-containing protein [Eubacteriales]|uniref:DUF4956 domain-containing protein n=1 Tax=Bittarella massiliensis (ex Durand et al. 2017) TaxID=1720313 RepID=A0AAQ1MDR4_9FIRM|nr:MULTISPECIES: DUF4956 domain-containing protein [Eubacteriales]ERJ01067.1 hypothetical protein HMPREF0262_00203 [Clostridium sp. ATCC 29733]MZL69138.1 DUF4956 domain-containing protein [Bittarella massiliensis (ex Durand et al. 2017)]MZL79856.1 DUF4956 domain-containing protein [Bittarella massiliensis (ex Durand et al. 2017)]SHG13164.1 protein of unknown function [Bittarella massiliensis (ex Durand et al. 2017)]